METLTLKNKTLMEKSEQSEKDLRTLSKKYALIETEKSLIASRLKKAEKNIEELYAELE